ncbi:MAG: sigma 54-interacting transcriptional regulator [Planctomycetes bacterium]|nr:sigma 54-interacting transcriptional regulator [Planctomycetota bacterium]NUQ35153.1 sigma 54-interacting transcriptional regulator [Planctomycetaceae bacterium]
MDVLLPRHHTGFIGRERELAALSAAIIKETQRLVTLTGFGGAGKTRIAVEWARREQAHFAAGVFFTDLASATDEDGICRLIANTLGAVLTGEDAPEHVARALTGRCSNTGGNLLLILDNVEQCVEGAGHLAAIWRESVPGMTMLFTSRIRLHIPGEREIALPSLTSPATLEKNVDVQKALSSFAAVNLFVQRAQEADPSFEATPNNIADIATICSRLDGLPLAIELAAARVTVLGPREIVERLGERLDAFQSSHHGTPERHSSLRAAVDWSWNLLGESEREMLAKLSVFRGGFFIEDVPAVCGVNIRQATDIVQRLKAGNLLRSERIEALGGALRFSMLESIAGYASERLAGYGEAPETRARWQEWLLGKCARWRDELRNEHAPAAYRRLALELDGILDIVNGAHAGIEERAWACVSAADVLSRQGPHNLALQLLQQTARLFGIDLDADGFVLPDGAPVALHWLVVRYAILMKDRAPHKVGVLVGALPADSPALFEGVNALSMAKAALGDLEGSLECTQRAERIANLHDYQRVAIKDWRAVALLQLGKSEEAWGLLKDLLPEAQKLTHRRVEAYVLMHLGIAASDLGHYGEAIEYCQRAIALETELGNQSNLAILYNNIAKNHSGQGERDQAADWYRKSLHISRALGSASNEALALFNLATILRDTGKTAEAMEYFERALAIGHDTRRPLIEAYSLTAIGRMLLGQETPSPALLRRAHDMLGSAHEIYRRTRQTTSANFLLALEGLMRCEISAGNTGRARELARDALAFHEQHKGTAIDGETMQTMAQTARRIVEGHTEKPADVAPAPENDALAEIIGHSPAIARLKALVRKVAASNVDVLILGETGTGKELIARSIHGLSARASQAFVAINCGALPPHLLESELFGHEKGAFTGADVRKTGLMEVAHQGTLFLDEIGEMPLEMQVKLLRALQERKIRRLGGTQEIGIDIRVVAATVQDLDRSIKEGRFRQDLYYRINVMRIDAPSLRERRDDIPLLASHFLESLASETPGTKRAFADQTLKALRNHQWPGNVRELANAIRHALAVAQQPVIMPSDLPASMDSVSVKILASGSPAQDALNRERAELAELLRNHRGDVGAAAKASGVHMVTLYRKLKKHGLEASDFRDG